MRERRDAGELDTRLAVGLVLHREPARGRRVTQDRIHVVGFRRVVGQSGEVHAASGGIETMANACRGLEMRQYRSVGLTPAAGWQRVLHGLSHQVMSERQVAAVANEQLARYALIQG